MSNLFFERTENERSFPPQPRASIWPLLRTIKRQALLITAVTATFTLLYSNINNKQPLREYAGNFQLLVEPITSTAKSSDPIAVADSGSRASELLEVDYPSTLEILTSRNILSDVVQQVKTQYPAFNLEQLKLNLQVERIGNNKLDASKIIAISYKDKDPGLVQLVLDSTAQKYLDYSLNSRKQGVDQGLEFIERQLPKLNDQISQTLNEIQDLQEEYQITEANATGESVFGSLQEIKLQKQENTKEISEKTRVVNNLQSQLNISIDEAIAISTLRENPNYQNLITQLNDLERELAASSARFNANSPQIRTLESEKQEILALLNTATSKILRNEEVSGRANRFLVVNNQDSILLSLVRDLVTSANELEILDARRAAINENLSSSQQQAQEFPEIARQYKKLQQELKLASGTREKLLVQKDKLDIQASQTKAPWSIVNEPAIPQDSAGQPKPIPIPVRTPNKYLQGLLGGLVLGIVAAMLWEKMRDVFYNSEDVNTAKTSSLVLGEIPYNRSFQQKYAVKNWLNLTPKVSQKEEDDENFLAAFERLFANIYFRYRDQQIRSIAICSPSGGDGKSTVATGLARAIANQGRRVMLVGANSFSYQLPENITSVNQVEENLYISIVSLAAMNSSIQRDKLMKEFQAEYEYVIYDTPAMMDSVTANFLSVNTDGVLLVTALGKTKKSLFNQALEEIEGFRLPLLGIVTNQNKSTGLSNYSSIDFTNFGDRELIASSDANSTPKVSNPVTKQKKNPTKTSASGEKNQFDLDSEITIYRRRSNSRAQSPNGTDHWQN